MLKTVSKPRLPKFAAWPLGKGVLEDAAAGLDHLQDAEVMFHDYIVTRFVSDPKHRQQPYPLLTAEFTRLWKPEGEWRFGVWAVPFDCAPLVRKLVSAELLPRLRAWLEGHTQLDPHSTRPRLSFVAHFNEGEGHIEYDDR
jgi:hypothetical protein